MDELIKDGKNLNSSEGLSSGEINESQNDELAKRDRAKLARAYNGFDVNTQAGKMPEPLAIAIKEEAAMVEALGNYKVDNGNIVDKKTNKPAIKNPNKITESEKNALLMQFGGVIDKGGNLTLGSGDSKFTLITNAGSMRSSEKKESTYSIPREEQEKLKKSINENANKSNFDISNIKADYKLTDGKSYEIGMGLGMKKIHEKGVASIKLHFKKLIEIAERDHGIWLECERSFGGEFNKYAGGTAISLGDKMILKLSAQDLRKLEYVNLDQFGSKSFMGHQFSTAAELIYKTDSFLRELSLSIVHSKSDNHKFGLLGSELINDPAFKQYIEYYGYFQGVTRDEAKAKFDFELNKRLRLSVGGGIERIVYNKLGKNVLGDTIETPNNTKIGPTGELSLTWQPEGDKVRITPGVKASGTMREVGIGAEVMLGKGVSVEGKIGRTQHVGTNRPSDTTGYAGFNRIIGSDKDKFDPLFEPSFADKSQEMYQSLLSLRDRQLTKNQITMLADSMKGRPAASCLENVDFTKSLKLIANKLGIDANANPITIDGFATLIHMIDYQSRVRFGTAMLPEKYKDAQHLFISLDKKSEKLFSHLIQLDKQPLSSTELLMLADTMKGRKIDNLFNNPSFIKSLHIIGTKLGLSNLENKLKSPAGLAITILMIDYYAKNKYNTAILPEKYNDVLQLTTEELNDINLGKTAQLTLSELDKINQVKKGVTLADLQTQMHGENIYGRGYVDKVSIWKYNKGNGVAENPDGSLDITTSSATLIVGSNASGSNPAGLTDLFKTISATTVRITLEQVKELHRRAGASNVNLNFAETGGTFLNLNLAITKGSVHFTTNKQISRMPSDFSIEMLNNRVDMKIIDSVIAGQLTIATAADMVFNRGNFTTALVNRFLSGQYSYLVMNGIKAGTYGAADIAKLQAGTLTNAEAEALLSGGAPSSMPGSFDMSAGNDTGTSSTDDYTSNTTPTFTWAAVAGATGYEFSSDGGTSYVDIGNVLTYTVPSALTDGAKTIMIRAKNGSGAGPANSLTVTIDTNNVATIGNFTLAPDTKSTVYTGLLMNFGGEALYQVVSVTSSNGGTISNVGLPNNGQVRLDWTTPNAAGSVLSFTVRDQAGNEKVLTKAVTLPNDVGPGPDTTPPSTPVFSITEGSYTKATAINLNVTANADVAGWYVSESSSAPAVGDAGWTSSAPTTFTLSAGDGTKNVYVYAKDAAGNVQPTGGTRLITLDTVAPSGTPAFVGTTPDTKQTSYSGLVLNFSENLTGGNITGITSSNGGAISNISINGAGNVIFDWTSPNAAGTQFTITGTDRAGNNFSLIKNVTLPNSPLSAPTSVPGSFTLTTDSGVSGSDLYTNINTPTFTWAAVANATAYEISTDGGTNYTDIGDVLTYAVPSALADGAYSIKVRAKNGVGNGPATTLAVNVDTSNVVTIGNFNTAPDTKSTTYNGLVMNFAGEDIYEIVSVTSSNGGTISGATVSSQSQVTFNWLTPNAGGSTLSFTVKDQAGNQKVLTKAVTLPNSPNNAPVFGVGSVADTLTLGSGMGGYVLPTATDTDAGDTLTYSISNPSVLGAGVTFDPATRSFNGTVGGVARTETLTYTVSDGNGGTANIPVIFTIS